MELFFLFCSSWASLDTTVGHERYFVTKRNYRSISNVFFNNKCLFDSKVGKNSEIVKHYNKRSINLQSQNSYGSDDFSHDTGSTVSAQSIQNCQIWGMNNRQHLPI